MLTIGKEYFLDIEKNYHQKTEIEKALYSLWSGGEDYEVEGNEHQAILAAAELSKLNEKLRRYQLYYEHVDGYEKLAAEFGACEHPESSVWLAEWLDRVLMRIETEIE